MPRHAILAVSFSIFKRRGKSVLLAWLCLALERQRQRHALAALDHRLLRDIGLTAEQARAETGKPFWKP